MLDGRGFDPYCGGAPAAAEWLWRWNLDPVLMAALLLTAVACARLPEARRRACGLAGVLALAVSFVSPLCALSVALFSARVGHHLLLTLAAAPLLALALPRPAAGRARRLPLATALQVAALWAVHAPPVYGWMLSDPMAYWLAQLTLLGSAVAGWWTLRAAPAPAQVGWLGVLTVQMGLLGALLTFAPRPLYAAHAVAPFGFGLSPLADQQLAGLIMWAPAAGVYLAAALWTLHRWLGAEQAGGAAPA